jgi:hypothetical protein
MSSIAPPLATILLGLERELEQIELARRELDAKADAIRQDILALRRVGERGLLPIGALAAMDHSPGDAHDLTISGLTRADALRAIIAEVVGGLPDRFTSKDVMEKIESHRPELLTDRAYATRLFREYVRERNYPEVKAAAGPHPAVFQKP